ncbi:hypothetical protein ABHN11_29705 [Brevibacillus centrosporus]|uniref:hypothetical protein n=1 Tax=Brevibacillus centrosporus TaxID=54910 RepID=UPI003D1A4F17
MAGVINGSSWTRRGISLLWDSNSLSAMCQVEQIHSLRQFLYYYQTEWPEELHSADGFALIVAGLDTIFDTMEPEALTDWLERVFYQALLSFQHAYEGQCGLIFWLPEGQKRIVQNMTDGLFYWKLSGEYHGETITLSSCLWNGAARDAKLISRSSTLHDVTERDCIGLFHPRIS